MRCRVRRVARVVGDHADRRAAQCSSLSSSITASPFFESRLPVGSSASRIDGSPHTARATATRCCWPPESWLGRCLARCAMPTRSSAAVHALLALGRAHAAVGQRQLHVLEHVEIADQVEALEDEADLAVADARPLRRRQLGHGLVVAACRCRRSACPAGRGSRAAWTCRIPTGRQSTTYSPRSISMLMLSSACVSTSSVRNTFFTVFRADQRLQLISCPCGVLGRSRRRTGRTQSQADMSDSTTRSPSFRPDDHDDRVDRAAAELDLHALGVAVGVDDLEEGRGAVVLAERRPADVEHVLEPLQLRPCRRRSSRAPHRAAVRRSVRRQR